MENQLEGIGIMHSLESSAFVILTYGEFTAGDPISSDEKLGSLKMEHPS